MIFAQHSKIAYNIDMNPYIKNGLIRYEKKTEFGKIQVVDTVMDDEAVCILFVDGQMESGVYLDEERKNELLFPYMLGFSYAFEKNPAIQNVLLIGGGGFAYPKYFLAHYPHTKITVAEISPEIVSVTHEYFGLDEMDVESYARMHIVTGDGFAYLKDSDEKFDLIINDAFVGRKDIGRQKEDIENIAYHLNEKGMYITNVPTALKGWNAHKGHRYQKLLQGSFACVEVMQAEEDRTLYEMQNVLMYASN